MLYARGHLRERKLVLRRCYLPLMHIGSERYMQQNFHDCMAICCVYGPPDKFTTFTCNTKWPEIHEAIRFEPGQKPCDRSDIVVRVFHMKLSEYLGDIRQGHVRYLCLVLRSIIYSSVTCVSCISYINGEETSCIVWRDLTCNLTVSLIINFKLTLSIYFYILVKEK